MTNFEAVFGLYALQKFSYGPEQVGTILMVIAIVSTIGKAALTGPATKRWGDVLVIRASLLAGSIGFIVLLLANTYITILLATAFFILSKTLLRPASLSLISKRSTVGQGTAMGLGSSFTSLGRIIGPIWAGFLFDVNVNLPYHNWFDHYVPGLPDRFGLDNWPDKKNSPLARVEPNPH